MEEKGSVSKWLVRRRSRIYSITGLESVASTSLIAKSINDLPEEIILIVASYLKVGDVISLCHTNRYLFRHHSQSQKLNKSFRFRFML